MRYIEGILTGAPIWVWPPLVALIIIGLRSTKPRSVPIWLVYAMPLLALSSFGRVMALAEQPYGLHGYVAGYALGAPLGGGSGRQRRVGPWPTRRQIHTVLTIPNR